MQPAARRSDAMQPKTPGSSFSSLTPRSFIVSSSGRPPTWRNATGRPSLRRNATKHFWILLTYHFFTLVVITVVVAIVIHVSEELKSASCVDARRGLIPCAATRLLYARRGLIPHAAGSSYTAATHLYCGISSIFTHNRLVRVDNESVVGLYSPRRPS